MKLVKFGGSGHFSQNIRKECPLQLGMLMYGNHFQNWLGFGHSLLIFLIFGATLT